MTVGSFPIKFTVMWRKWVAVTWISFSTVAFSADGAFRLNNFDANAPIFFEPSIRLPVEDSYVQVLAGFPGGPLVVLSNSAGETVFRLSEPGFFDGGFGVVPNVPENVNAQVQVRAWRYASTFDSASFTGLTEQFIQPTGTFAQPAILQMPSFGMGIPEPDPLLLGLLGSALFLALRLFKR